MSTTVRQALASAARLVSVTATPALDAEVLLAHVLQRPRAWLYSWPEQVIEEATLARFHQLLARRVQGQPVAYLVGQQAFWTLELRVTPAVLIPRPETELLVEQALRLGPEGAARVVDMGTGSGAVALALAAERPMWSVLATDASDGALAVARDNAQRLALSNVSFALGSWFDAIEPGACFDLVVSNPPYIDPQDPHLHQGALVHEPRMALVSDDTGLADIRVLACEARSHLVSGGHLLLEHGHDQGAAVRAILGGMGYSDVVTVRDLAGHERVSMAQWCGVDSKSEQTDA